MNAEALSDEEQHQITEALVRYGKKYCRVRSDDTKRRTIFDDFIDQIVDDAYSEETALSLLSPMEEAGLRLFVGEGQCHLCHNGPTFSNDTFHNIGLGPRDWLDDTDIGLQEGITVIQESEFNSRESGQCSRW